MSNIVPEAIHGLEEGTDTGINVHMKSGSVRGIVHQGIIVTDKMSKSPFNFRKCSIYYCNV